MENNQKTNEIITDALNMRTSSNFKSRLEYSQRSNIVHNNKIENYLDLNFFDYTLIDVNKIFPCQIKELKLSCYGCCGRNFTSKEDVLRDLKLNTKDFQQIKTPSTLRLLQFRDRLSDDPSELMFSNLCSNIVDFGDNCIACPLHYAVNKIVPKEKFTAIHKKDLRINHCDVNYECETFIFWKIFSEKQKKEYIEFLSKQDYDKDLYLYSTENIKGIIIKKFMDEKNYNF